MTLEPISPPPPIPPSPQRLEVFQGRVMGDKVKLGIPTSRTERHTSAYIDVHRNRILEDGYTQLSSLTSKTLKGTIRVKFFNEQVSTCIMYARYSLLELRAN